MNHTIRAILERKGSHVETISAETTVLAAVVHMNARHIGSVLVLEAGGPVGILTERDIMRRIPEEQRDPKTTTVGEVMTTDLVVIDPQMSVGHAMTIVTKRRCRHLPVVVDGQIIGLVSAGDLTASLVDVHERTIADLTDYITR